MTLHSLHKLSSSLFIIFQKVYLLAGNSSYADLYEIYRVCNDIPLSVNLVRTFKLNQNRSKKTDFIWDRRKDLQGCTLRVNYFEDYPNFMIASDSILENDNNHEEDRYLTAGNMTVYGTFAELYSYFVNQLNFSIEWVSEKDSMYGSFDHTTKKWNGLIGQLIAGEADMSIFHLSVLLSRSLVVSFSDPIENNDFGLYMQYPEQSFTWSTFSQIFTSLHWLTILITSVVCCICLFIAFEIHHRKNESGKPNKRLNVCRRIANNIGSGVAITGLSLGEQDVNQVQEQSHSCSFSIKTLYLTVILFGSLNFKTWESSLTSNLAVQNYEHPIKSLGDFLNHSEYQLLFLRGSAAELFFLDAAELEVESQSKIVWKKLLENDDKAVIDSNDEQEETILKRKTNVVLTDAFSARLWGNRPCKITTAPSRYNKHSLAYPFKKNSPFLKVFDNVLNIMQETGTIQNTQRHVVQYKPLTVCDKKRDWSIGYENIFSAFVIVGSGCIIALLVWLFELLFINV